MIRHTDLGTTAFARARQLYGLVRNGAVALGGNRKLRIYGLLTCRSGKRMLPRNRVFFKNEAEVLAAGYRPCGHCLPDDYRRWKQAHSKVTTQPAATRGCATGRAPGSSPTR